jgi:5-methylcytosine-specific restriction protein A
VISKGRGLRCEGCNDDLQKKYGPKGMAGYEVHHRNRISQGERWTLLSQLAVLCANCHRLIHQTKPLMSTKEFKRWLEKQ